MIITPNKVEAKIFAAALRKGANLGHEAKNYKATNQALLNTAEKRIAENHKQGMKLRGMDLACQLKRNGINHPKTSPDKPCYDQLLTWHLVQKKKKLGNCATHRQNCKNNHMQSKIQLNDFHKKWNEAALIAQKLQQPRSRLDALKQARLLAAKSRATRTKKPNQ